MDRRSRQEQTDAVLSALEMVDPRTAAVIDFIRQELALLRDIAEAADAYRATTLHHERLDSSLDAWKGY